MTKITFKFAEVLGDSRDGRFTKNYGPTFKRWLPNGKYDAVVVPTKNGRVKLWFNRKAIRNEDGEFKYVYKNTEVLNESDLKKQELFDGGPLFGEFEVENVSNEIIDSLANNNNDSKVLIDFSKSILIQISDTSHRFVEIIRSHFGQSWLSPFPRFDIKCTKKGHINNFCHGIQLQYRIGEGEKWSFFEPDDGTFGLVALMGDYEGYLSRQDWSDLKRLSAEKFELSTASYLISSIMERYRERDIEATIFELVTAIEISLKEFVRVKIVGTDDKFNERTLNSFNSIGLGPKIALACTLSGFSNIEDIEKVIELVDIRNTYTHEGIVTEKEIKSHFSSALKVINHFNSGPEFKYLSSSPGNSYKRI
jgi:ribosomal protein L28